MRPRRRGGAPNEAGGGGAGERRDDGAYRTAARCLDEVRITRKMSERAQREVGHQIQLSGANKDEWCFTLERRGFSSGLSRSSSTPWRCPPPRRASRSMERASAARDARDARHRVVTRRRRAGAGGGRARELSRSVDGTQIDLTSRRRATTRSRRRRRAASRPGGGGGGLRAARRGGRPPRGGERVPRRRPASSITAAGAAAARCTLRAWRSGWPRGGTSASSQRGGDVVGGRAYV